VSTTSEPNSGLTTVAITSTGRAGQARRHAPGKRLVLHCGKAIFSEKLGV